MLTFKTKIGQELNVEPRTKITIGLVLDESTIFRPSWQKLSAIGLTLIGMRRGGFTPLVIFGLDFVSCIFIKNFQLFLGVKIEINRDNLALLQAH